MNSKQYRVILAHLSKVGSKFSTLAEYLQDLRKYPGATAGWHHSYPMDEDGTVRSHILAQFNIDGKPIKACTKCGGNGTDRQGQPCGKCNATGMLAKKASEEDPYAMLDKNIDLMLRLLSEGRISKADSKFVQYMNKFLAKNPENTELVLQKGLISQNQVDKNTLALSGITEHDEADRALRQKHFGM